MKLAPLEASLFLSQPLELQDSLRLSYVVPVNDKLLPIWEKEWDVMLLYGSRGGGKSEGVVDDLLNECLTQTYFKCFYGRKVFDNVRGSQFATLVESIKKNKLTHLFRFSEADNSSMIITCLKNGNKFIPFGSDKADKLKSIKDPTHIWCEEFDQFAFDDFKELYPTLRTPRGANRFLATFNSYAVGPSHWILKIFFPSLYQGTDKEDIAAGDLLDDKQILKIFINYSDNYFIDREEYRKKLWLAAAGNYEIFEGLANGAWGIEVNDSPWAYAFDRKKHVSDGVTIPHPVLDRRYPVYVCFDFNRNPFAFGLVQWYDNAVKVLEAKKLSNSGVDAACEYVKAMYPGCLYIVTGDYSGVTETSLFQEQVTHYTLIKRYLNLSDGQIKIKPNPKLAKNSTHVNQILAFYNVVMHGINARPLIFDMENVKRRADGTIVKEDRNDPAQQSDSLDWFRYFCNIFLDWFKPTL